MEQINIKVATEIFGWVEHTYSRGPNDTVSILAPSEGYIKENIRKIPQEGYFPAYILVPDFAGDYGLAVQAAIRAGMEVPVYQLPTDPKQVITLALSLNRIGDPEWDKTWETKKNAEMRTLSLEEAVDKAVSDAPKPKTVKVFHRTPSIHDEPAPEPQPEETEIEFHKNEEE